MRPAAPEPDAPDPAASDAAGSDAAAPEPAGADLSPSRLTVADLVGRALARLGAGHCFGVVGSGNFAVTNALREAGVPFTATRHEGGAATMADAFARMSGTVALVSVHQGCGLTNAATGIGEAAKSRTPVIVLAAEASGASVGSNFSMDQPGLARSVLADSHRVHSAASALVDVVRAFRAARDERRTVVLNLPLDVQAQPAPADALRALDTLAPPPRPVPPRADADAVTALARLISTSERPVIVAGRGARGAGPELRALASAAGALLATSAVAKGLFAGDPFDLGISGGFSSPLSAELISRADLIIGAGCALNMWTMRHGRLIGPDTRVAQIDLEASALGAQRPIDLGVLGDAASTATAVLEELTRFGHDPEPRYRTPEVAARIAAESRWSDVPLDPPDLGGPARGAAENSAAETRIDPRVLSRELNRLLPAERIVSVDSGNFMGYPSAYLDVPDEFGFCFTQAFQSIGLGLSTAIGAALARPDRLPVLGTGDGGLLMGIAELETAVRLELPLLVVVYNDDAYGAEVHHFGVSDDPDFVAPDLGAVTFPSVDIASIARGFGAQGATVREAGDLEAVRRWLESGPTSPLVLDARIASDGGAWWLAEAFRGH
ncbi:thiamine pyrophosphate-binding protein [Leucobacter tenebrionis]|uniref:thiamine pyrophosphate-binding protein n=1 Tax=Leucobacter tenebrionis TaxID=2873270 RepID=UPI001CA63370|nr:thiamine pyrophosphate-binding protein [Leucobacter tenebrionis]QZY50978.1 thiamine pyrophosphate-binding protein [Leucobacter tenebrionis]